MTKALELKPRRYRLLILFAFIQICSLTALGQNSVVIRMDVDATEAARNLLHTTVHSG